MTKQLSIDVTDKQYDLMKRIARANDRRLEDLLRLVLAEGFEYYWSEDSFSFKKNDDEFTEEDRKQLAKNDEIKKKLAEEGKYVHQLSNEEEEKLGYKNVCEWHRGGGYRDEDLSPNICYVLSEAIKEALYDQEEN
jgi:hypothetical protein